MAKELPDSGVIQFTQIIAKAVLASKMSQREFAKTVDVGQSTISAWIANLKAKNKKLNVPRLANISQVAGFIKNPKTQQAFTPSELCAVCYGELKFSKDEIKDIGYIPEPQEKQSKTASQEPVDVAQVYWDQLISPNVKTLLEKFGKSEQDGSRSFESKEYSYHQSKEGELSILPKDGREPLNAHNMNKRDIKVLTAMADQLQSQPSEKQNVVAMPQQKAAKIRM